MRINKFILLSIIASSSLVSCGPKIIVENSDESKGTISYFIKDKKLVMQAYPKDNYLFTGWFIKEKGDEDYRFDSASNPYVLDINKDATYQARFEDYSTQTFVFNMEKNDKGIVDHVSISNYFGDFENVIIPSTHYGYPVTEIKEKTFISNTKLKTIANWENIKVIGKDAFKDCIMESFTIDHELEKCETPFTGWTDKQTIYISKQFLIEKTIESKTYYITSWGWTLTPVEDTDYFKSSNSGSTEVKIKKI